MLLLSLLLSLLVSLPDLVIVYGTLKSTPGLGDLSAAQRRQHMHAISVINSYLGKNGFRHVTTNLSMFSPHVKTFALWVVSEVLDGLPTQMIGGGRGEIAFGV